MNVHDITRRFEEAICDYTGSPYCVCLNNGSSAIFLALTFDDIRGKTISIPKRTYMSVPCEIIHAGGRVHFYDVEGTTLKGAYQLKNSNVIDSALRFTADMYNTGTYMCCSFTGPYKHLKLGKGGCILHDNPEADKWFRKASFSGRNPVPYIEDIFTMTGWNFYMLPEIATAGLREMRQFYKNGVKKHMPDIELNYPDLSQFPIYTK